MSEHTHATQQGQSVFAPETKFYTLRAEIYIHKLLLGNKLVFNIYFPGNTPTLSTSLNVPSGLKRVKVKRSKWQFLVKKWPK